MNNAAIRIRNRFFRARKKFLFGSAHHKLMTLITHVLPSARRILLYTDSRGDNLPDHIDYQHYGERLAEWHSIDAYLCPEKWTTVIDFLELYEHLDTKAYDLIILHAGAVDASPRSQTIMLEQIYPPKKRMFDKVFGESNIQAYLKSDLNCEFEGDKTINMYSPRMAARDLLPRLRQIPNLIWVGANRIVPNWRGNYWRDRPANIQIIEEYSKLFRDELPQTVDLLEWSLEDVQRFTFDNIHPNKDGSDYILREILEKIRMMSN